MPSPCGTALELAIVTLEALPELAVVTGELIAAVTALVAADEIGVGTVVAATAVVTVAKQAYTQALAISTTAAAAINNAIACVLNFIASLTGTSTGGGTRVNAVAPVPVITGQAGGVGSCATKQGNRGICCAAITQLGLARAAQGFQYTNCNGKTVCLACGTKASISKKNPGATVFSVKRVSCGPSGCPALGAIQGTITQPV